MQASFWHQKWEKGEIGFHEDQPNSLLLAHFDALKLNQAERVFLPLCGKTRDISWLLAQGLQVVGAELSELAIEQLFADLQLKPEIVEVGSLKHYHAQDLDIFVGDIFELTPELIGTVDAIYDRAALVALPPDTRQQYAAHLRQFSADAAQLVVTFEYDQAQKSGPPFSVDAAELKALYAAFYKLQKLEQKPVEAGKLGAIDVSESVWLLQPHQI